MKPLLVFVLAAAGALPSPAAAGNLLVNGSFESGPALPSSGYKDLASGSTAITGWVVGGFHIDYSSSVVWNVSDGSRNVDLDGSFGNPLNGSISQSFATTPGVKYRVTFDLSGNDTGAPLIKQLQVSAGNDVQAYSHDCGAIVPYVPPLALTYQHETFLFTAVASSSTLEFKSLPQPPIAPGYGAVIDNVVVEPATWTDLGFALPGVAGAPLLVGTGDLLPGSAGTLTLSDSAPSAPALMFIGLSAAPTPFKGGMLVPVPALLKVSVTTSPIGTVPLAWAAWPSGLSGLSLYFQYAVKDLAAVHGVSLSHAVRGDVP